MVNHKSSDWCLFGGENSVILNEVDEQENPNVARSIIPPEFYYESSHSTKRRGLSNLIYEVEQMKPEAAKQDLTLFAHSPDKAIAEIKRLENIAHYDHSDKNTTEYCNERIKYLRLIIEDHFYNHMES